MKGALRVGVVGCGVVATRDLLPNLTHPEVRERLLLTAVADVVPERAQQTAEQFGAAHWFTSADELALCGEVDLVAVTTPVRHHLSAAMAAISAGKHLCIQKTMTETVEEADLLIAAARAKGVRVVAQPGNHIRSKALTEIRALVADGVIGKICWGRSAKGTRHEDDLRRNDDPGTNVDPSWYYKPGGGPLRDAAVYDIQALTWLLGPAKRVTAMSGIAIPQRGWRDTTINVEMDDNTHFMLDFGNACYVVFSSHFVFQTPRTPTLELYGERGGVVVGGGAQGSYELYGQRRDARDRHGFLEELVKVGAPALAGSAMVGLESYVVADLIHLADSVLADRPPLLSPEHARHGIEIIQKVYESARTGRALDLTTTFPSY